MTHLIVDPNQLRQLSSQIEQAATQIQSAGADVQRAWNSMDLEARQQAQTDAQVALAQQRAMQLADRARTLVGFLRAKAQVFEDTDRQGAGSLDQIQTNWAPRQAQWTAQWQAIQERDPAKFTAILDKQIAADAQNMAGRQKSNQCVLWADQRRLSLGGRPLPAIGPYGFADDPGRKYSGLGAKHLAQIYGPNGIPGTQIVQYTQHQQLAPGTAIVWDNTLGGGSGHVAIVEAANDNGIWVSESNWVSSNYPSDSDGTPGPHIRYIPINDLNNTHVTIIPKQANPAPR